MSEHTKGPWIFEELAAHDGDGYVLTEDNTVICHHGGAYSKGLARGEVLANGLLISAAPELLELAEAALEWIDSVPQDTELPAMPGFDRDWAENVLAKAKGES